MVAAGIVFLCGYDATFLTGINAKMAFFAKFLINLNVTFQNQSSYMFKTIVAIVSGASYLAQNEDKVKG
jgi:hypothetical protein